MSEKKVVYIGGKQIGVNCLRYLVNQAKILPSLVIANMDDDGNDKSWHESLVKAGKELNLDVIYKTKVRDQTVIDKIKEINPDIICCIGITQLIPQEVLDVPKLGCLNIHPALLPRYRGRYSTVHALFNGEEYFGVTAHWMDDRIDAGPIITQRKIKIEQNDTAKTIYDTFTKVGEEIFVEVMTKFQNGEEIASTPQDETQATYIKKGLPNNGEIDWNWSGKKIYDFIRCMTFEPFSPATFQIGDKKMVIVDEKYIKATYPSYSNESNK